MQERVCRRRRGGSGSNMACTRGRCDDNTPVCIFRYRHCSAVRRTLTDMVADLAAPRQPTQEEC